MDCYSSLRMQVAKRRCKCADAAAQSSPGKKPPLDFAGKNFHFIGAGGVGMSGLAKLLIKNGATVRGSDQMISPVVRKLCEIGADIKLGHNSANLDGDIEAVVISAAIPEDNPELRLARHRNIPVYKYAQMLGELMELYDGIAVCGTHGKSTTSGWIVFVLRQAAIEPSFIIGADIIQLGTSSGVGNGPCFVAEACEYDRSFLNLHPKTAVLLNIEQDHLDYYKDEQEIVGAFEEFARGLKKGGVIIANGDDANVAAILRKLAGRLKVVTFGFGPDCDIQPANIRQTDGLYEFDVHQSGKLLGSTKISIPGRHNLANALAVIGAALNIGLRPQQIFEILPDFTGMDRRLMLKAHLRSVTVLDDYAHHPTEIKASLRAIRDRFGGSRIWCIFQPHQYSRTRFLLDDFAESFKLADVTIVPDIYFVRDTEAARKQVNSQTLVDRMREQGSEALFISTFEQIQDYLRNNVAAGDVVITMGAGDIWKVADEYIQWLGGNS